jgi:hypothetical protein
MPSLITTLIDRRDNSELICDQIGAILAAESAAQQALATNAGKNPKLWKLRVFTERTNAWEMWLDAPSSSKPKPDFDRSPIVNVSFDQETFDKSKGDPHERQAAEGTFFIDCFGLGISADNPNTAGHFTGDALAAIEAKRAYRLVRTILMSAHYITLGFPGKPNAVIWGGRWITSIQMSPVGPTERIAQHIVGARVALTVTFNEFSQQVQAVPLELISASFIRADNGELMFAAEFPIGA